MARSINEIMTHDPRAVSPDDTLVDAARHMREGDAGTVVVVRDNDVAGILTDRDIVVRAIADGRDPSSTKVGDVATESPVTITPETDVKEAARLVREHNIRRLVVVQDGRPAGVVSIGDLAMELDEDSALADMAAAAPNN